MQKNLKVRLIQNIPETELETEFESESGIFLLTISPIQLSQCKSLWDSPQSLWGIPIVTIDRESASSELGGLQEI